MSRSAERERVLVVDDAADTLELLRRNLVSEGYQVLTASDVPSAIRIIETAPIDVVITDLKMPRVSGMDLVKHVRENYKQMGIMMITGYPSIQTAVQAVKDGAEDYLAKPFTGEELLTAVRHVLDGVRARRQGKTTGLGKQPVFQGMITESRAMRRVADAIVKAAGTLANVLITGESGTGKELAARAIHYSSPRASSPFVPVNCGGIPEGLLESELFGHVKGSFTGSTDSRLGFFQTADGGTIFLDEISETTPAMQVKLLRVLQDKEVYMIGSRRSQKVDVRVVAATNKDLMSLVRKGVFREDLFYRLNVISIEIPSLRDRRDDIPPLIHHFAAKFACELGDSPKQVTDKALRVLMDYPWPGNVRELENTIQRVLVMSEGDQVDVPDLPAGMRFSAVRGVWDRRNLAEVEAEHIRYVLASVLGNKTRAAEILGIDRKTLREKLKRIEDSEQQ